ncbi:Uncharacterised protein [Kingella potus]|uniref:Uncharacterized protein n=1 Tax=Kingella potus TaxID=265175 RepID=A0A377QXX9_9NEIS|nr:hypothetical protein [Kingella potus]STQ99852.1 Uncharacterised protein [Kingella potus]
MQLKRKDTGEILALPDDMQWQDEMEWSAVAQAAPQRTLSGGLVIQQGVKQNGRPVTLSGDWAWHRRADLLRLRGWSDTAGLIMTLTLPDGRSFDTAFRLHDKLFGKAEAVAFRTPETDDTPYLATINLMTV